MGQLFNSCAAAIAGDMYLFAKATKARKDMYMRSRRKNVTEQQILGSGVRSDEIQTSRCQLDPGAEKANTSTDSRTNPGGSPPPQPKSWRGSGQSPDEKSACEARTNDLEDPEVSDLIKLFRLLDRWDRKQNE